VEGRIFKAVGIYGLFEFALVLVRFDHVAIRFDDYYAKI